MAVVAVWREWKMETAEGKLRTTARWMLQSSGGEGDQEPLAGGTSGCRGWGTAASLARE